MHLGVINRAASLEILSSGSSITGRTGASQGRLVCCWKVALETLETWSEPSRASSVHRGGRVHVSEWDPCMWRKACLHHRHPANLRFQTGIKTGNGLYGPVNRRDQMGWVLQHPPCDLNPPLLQKIMQITTFQSTAGAPLTSQTREKDHLSASLTWDAILKSIFGDCSLSQRKVSPVHHRGSGPETAPLHSPPPQRRLWRHGTTNQLEGSRHG